MSNPDETTATFEWICASFFQRNPLTEEFHKESYTLMHYLLLTLLNTDDTEP